MANYFLLTLDTLGPASPTIVIEGGSSYASAQLVNLALGCGDGVTTGYQMKIWGSVDPVNDANIQTTEGASAWITYSTSKQVKLSAGDGSKTLNFKVRDDVYNPSGQASSSISMDTAIPVVTITGPSTSKISKITGKEIVTFSFISDSIFSEYKVKVVTSMGATESTGIVVGTASGSTNMKGIVGGYAANTAISCSITGADLELASSGDGSKTIKVFVKDEVGLWSV